MTNLTPSIMGPGVGLYPGNGSVLVRNATANTLTAGMIVMLDLGATGTVGDDVTSAVPGHVGASGTSDNVFGNVIAVASASNSRYGQFFVVLETIASGSFGKVAPTGIVTANIVGNTVTSAGSGAPLVVASYTNATLGSSGLWLQPAFITQATASTASMAGEKIVGYLLGATISNLSATNHSTTISTQASVWFNGIGAGFGQNAI